MMRLIFALFLLLAVLQENPKDEKAFHCKIVSLIQLGKFDDVVVSLKKNPDMAEWDQFLANQLIIF